MPDHFGIVHTTIRSSFALPSCCSKIIWDRICRMNVHTAFLTMVTKSFCLFSSHNYVTCNILQVILSDFKSYQCYYVAFCLFFVAFQPQVTNNCHMKKSNLNILLNISFCVPQKMTYGFEITWEKVNDWILILWWTTIPLKVTFLTSRSCVLQLKETKYILWFFQLLSSTPLTHSGTAAVAISTFPRMSWSILNWKNKL